MLRSLGSVQRKLLLGKSNDCACLRSEQKFGLFMKTVLTEVTFSDVRIVFFCACFFFNVESVSLKLVIHIFIALANDTESWR